MSEQTAVLTALGEIKAEQGEQRGILDGVRTTGLETKTDLKKIDGRLQQVEQKVAIVKGMWLAVVVVSTLFGIAGVVVAIVSTLVGARH